MGNNKNIFNLGISLAKHHILAEGEIEWLLSMTKNYIQQTDYQCWRIIEKGEETLKDETDIYKWGPVEYATLEKNAKAKQLILNALSRKDIDKIISLPNAKLMWNAIIDMHSGSEDMKNNRRFELQRDFHSFKMGESKSVSDYHSRFQVLCDKMSSAGLKVQPWELSLAFIYGVNAKFDTTKRIMLMTKETKELPVFVLARKLRI